VGEWPIGTRVRKPVQKFGAETPETKQPKPASKEQSSDDDDSPSNSDEFDTPPASQVDPGSEDDVEDTLQPSEDEGEVSHLADMCWEGGTQAIKFLLSKVVSPTSPSTPTKPHREWSFRDIASLPQEEREMWRTACEKNWKLSAGATFTTW